MKISREAKIGAVVVVAAAFLIYGINYLKGIDLFKKGREFKVEYTDLNGLVTAGPVSFQGMKVGQVTSIDLHRRETGEYYYEVTFVIDNNDLQFPDDSKARLFSSDLFGTRAIDIIPGLSGTMAQEGLKLSSETEESMISRVDAQIAPIKKKAESLMGSLDTMVTAVSHVVGENAEDLGQTIESMKLTIRNLKQITDKVNGLLESETGKVSSILTKFESISGNIQRNNESIDKSLDNVAAITDSLKNAGLASTVKQLSTTVTELNSILTKVNTGEGTLGALINSDSLYLTLVQTNDQLNRLVENIKEHPNRYLHFSVFGRKEKGLKLDAREEKKLKQILQQ
ncbi:MAG TPA: MlaD family protein [Flavobacteriales bacterium]|nr:MlaD family protein [Flavobacteriales bacterium]